jgi:uncharacterized protein (TIGR03086 family)
MSEISERFTKVADQFTRRVVAVPATAWDNPAPPEGWVARDVVEHLVEWVPSFLETYAGVELPTGPAVADDPVGAWTALRDGLQATLDDPETAVRPCNPPPGPTTVEQAVDQFMTNDILVHTWDLARATGLDETLDPDEVHRLLVAMEPYDDALRASGQYGPRVHVPDDADEQTKLIAFTGRRP